MSSSSSLLSVDVSKCGVLSRRGLMLGRWAQRYYILRDTFLFVCRSEPSSIEDGIAHPDFVIFLNAPAGVECRTAPSAKGHPHVFTIAIKNPKEEHVLSAPSAEERTDWIESINASIKLYTDSVESDADGSGSSSAAIGRSRQSSRVNSRAASRTGSPTRMRAATKAHQRNGTHLTSSFAPTSTQHLIPGDTTPHTLPPGASRTSFLDADTEDNFGSPLDTDPYHHTHLAGTMPHTSDLSNRTLSAPFSHHRTPSQLVNVTPNKQVRKQLFVATESAANSAEAATHTNHLSTTVASPARHSKTLSLQSSATGSSRSKVQAALGEADQLRLDAFTLRSQANILDGDETDEFGADFSSQDLESRWDAPQPTEADLYDDDDTIPNATYAPTHTADRDRDPSTPTHSHRRTVSTSNATTPRSSPNGLSKVHAAASPSISALDEDTRLKLKQIEASSNDPELLALLAEHQLLDDKLAKLRLHKKVLGNELKTILPKLAVQQKVNSQFTEEILFHRSLKSSRTAHRIQICNWLQSMKQRLKDSEPQVLLKHQRRMAMQAREQQKQYTGGDASYASPVSRRTPSPHVQSSPYSPYSPYTPSLHAPYTPPPTRIVHSELIRLSNSELDQLESELQARRPDQPPSAHVLSALEKEELMYVDADAAFKPPDFGSAIDHTNATHDEYDGRSQRGLSERVAAVVDFDPTRNAAGQKSNSAPDAISPRSSDSIPPSVSPSPSPSTLVGVASPTAVDSHSDLLRAHSTNLRDIQHVLTHILLREISVRRQLNLLQQSIYKLTSEKESTFRAKHALAAATTNNGNTQAKQTKGKKK